MLASSWLLPLALVAKFGEKEGAVDSMSDAFQLSPNGQKLRAYMPASREVWGDTNLLRKYLHRAAKDRAFVLKILVIGNSVTAGHWCSKGLYGHNDGETIPKQLSKKYVQQGSSPNTCAWSARLADSLNRLLPHDNFVVFNRGKNGAGIKDNLLQLQDFKKIKPHIVILDEALSDSRIDRAGALDVVKATEEMIDEVQSLFDPAPAVLDVEMVAKGSTFLRDSGWQKDNYEPFNAQKIHASVCAYHRVPVLSMNNVLSYAYPIVVDIECFKHAYEHHTNGKVVINKGHPDACIHELMADIVLYFFHEELKMAPALTIDQVANNPYTAKSLSKSRVVDVFEDCASNPFSSSPENKYCLFRHTPTTAYSAETFLTCIRGNFLLHKQHLNDQTADWYACPEVVQQQGKDGQVRLACADGLGLSKSAHNPVITCGFHKTVNPQSNYSCIFPFKNDHPCPREVTKGVVSTLGCGKKRDCWPSTGESCDMNSCLPLKSGWTFSQDVAGKFGWTTCGGASDSLIFKGMKSGTKGVLVVGFLMSYSPGMGKVQVHVLRDGKVEVTRIINSHDPARKVSVFDESIIRGIPQNALFDVRLESVLSKPAASDTKLAGDCNNKFKLLALFAY